MVKVIVNGCVGRMGQRIVSLGIQHNEINIVGASEQKGHPLIGKSIKEICAEGDEHISIVSDITSIIDTGDVLIDFTSPSSTLEALSIAVAHKKKMVIGTTGLQPQEEEHIRKASSTIPIVYAPNMSVGVNLLFKLTHLVSSILNDDYDVEIVETHHKFKKDAPSGTARALAEHVAQGRTINLAQQAVYGRNGMCGERKKGSIGIHAVRGGDVVGEHTVSFMTQGERVELTHRATSRDAFAQGALIAALFVDAKKNGLFSMQDVLGLA